MMRLKSWQWVILATPVIVIISFLMTAASFKINDWGLSWIWAVFTLIFVGWRWLLVQWTRPMVVEMETVITTVSAELAATPENSAERASSNEDITQQTEAALQAILQAAQNDLPLWEDGSTFVQRCQQLITDISYLYHPEVQYPLLNIYVPQAFALIRGTINDLDRWMQKLSPALNQVTVGQAVQAYQVYQKLEPSARKLLRVWNWVQWLLNPAAAFARMASQRHTSQANQQLVVNLSQLLRETALRNLCRQAVILYGGAALPSQLPVTPLPLPPTQTQTLKEILAQAEPVESIEQKPVNILLVGRTGAGKSSLINTLFDAEQAEVDILPSTDRIQSYHWQMATGETLTLWDTPGYEQVKQAALRQQVLDYAATADLLLLVTPALDPALQMDVDFLRDIKTTFEDLPTLAIITQVDRLRPMREWAPPYDWQGGDSAKETAIREATEYRIQELGDFCNLVLPIVTRDSKTDRAAWGIDALSWMLLEMIAPAKQLRLARFLQDLDARTVAAAKIIDHYTFQMATTQGVAAFLKTPVLRFISTLTTGSPTLAYLLAEKIPVEQLPIVLGKLQMAYDLYSLLSPGETFNFDLRSLWPLLLENAATPDRNAWAFGHALVEFWTQNLTLVQLRDRFNFYLKSA